MVESLILVLPLCLLTFYPYAFFKYITPPANGACLLIVKTVPFLIVERDFKHSSDLLEISIFMTDRLSGKFGSRFKGFRNRFKGAVIGKTRKGKITRAALTGFILVNAGIAISHPVAVERLTSSLKELFTPYDRYSTLVDPKVPIEYTGGYYGGQMIPHKTLYVNTLNPDNFDSHEAFMKKAFPEYAKGCTHAAIDFDYEKDMTPAQHLAKYGPPGALDKPAVLETLLPPCYIGLRALPVQLPNWVTYYPIKALKWLFYPPLIWVGNHIVIPRPVMRTARYTSYILGKIAVGADLIHATADIFCELVFPVIIDKDELTGKMKREEDFPSKDEYIKYLRKSNNWVWREWSDYEFWYHRPLYFLLRPIAWGVEFKNSWRTRSIWRYPFRWRSQKVYLQKSPYHMGREILLGVRGSDGPDSQGQKPGERWLSDAWSFWPYSLWVLQLGIYTYLIGG